MYNINYYNEWEYVLPTHLDNSNENHFTEELTYYKPYYTENAYQRISPEYLLKTEIGKECKNNWKFIAFTGTKIDYSSYMKYWKSLNGK
jgi:hypothetical protein